MSIYDRICNDCKIALKEQNKEKLSVLRVLISDIQRKYDKNYNDDWVIDTINKTLKFLEEVNTDKSFIEKQIIKEYLPIQISRDDVFNFITDNYSNYPVDKRMQLVKFILAKFPKGSISGSIAKLYVDEYFC